MNYPTIKVTPPHPPTPNPPTPPTPAKLSSQTTLTAIHFIRMIDTVAVMVTSQLLVNAHAVGDTLKLLLFAWTVLFVCSILAVKDTVTHTVPLNAQVAVNGVKLSVALEVGQRATASVCREKNNGQNKKGHDLSHFALRLFQFFIHSAGYF